MESVKDIFFLGIVIDVKNERDTRFWKDKWCANVPLELLFSELICVAQDPAGTVLSHW